MKSLVLLSFFGLVFGRPDIGLELRKKPLHTSYGVPVESVTGLPPVVNSYVPPSPTFQTPLVSTAVPFYSEGSVSPTIAPVLGPSFISQYSSQPDYSQSVYSHSDYPQSVYSQSYPQSVYSPSITPQVVYPQPIHPEPSIHPAQVQKHVYFYEAPEEPEDIHPKVTPTAPPSKKNVKIIFIKAPTYKVSPYIQPIYPQQEEKTLVYVLVKKPEDQQQIIVEPPPPTPPTKPEVYFIKYKNQAEAEEKVQDTLHTHAESGANVITNHVETGPVGLPIVTTPSPIISYVSTPINPGISITSNGYNNQFVSSTETPFVTSTYGPPIISSTEGSSGYSSTYYPSIDANKIVESYEAPLKPHQTYGPPSKK